MSDIQRVTLPSGTAVAVRQTVPMNELPAFFAQAFHELEDALGKSGAHPVGAPFARYHSAPPAPVDVEVMMPVDHSFAASGRVQLVELSGGPAVQVLHVGPYDTLGAVYAEIAQWLAAHDLEPADAPREVYLTEPERVPDPAQWQTLVVQPTRPRIH